MPPMSLMSTVTESEHVAGMATDGHALFVPDMVMTSTELSGMTSVGLDSVPDASGEMVVYGWI